MNLRGSLLLASIGLLPLACGGSDQESAADDTLIGGRSAGLTRPEVGKLWFDGTYCTATLIRQDIAITAAHCVGYGTATTEYGSIEFTGPNGSVRAQMKAYRSFASAVGMTDVALVRLASAVPTATAQAAQLSEVAPKVGDELTLFGYGCDDRAVRVSAGRTTRKVTYGSSQAVCPGDSGGPGFLSNGKLATITSGFFRTNGADVFAVPLLVKNELNAQLAAWGYPTQSSSGSARIWKQDASLGACSELTIREDFASGRFNVHQVRLSLPKGRSELDLGVAGGSWNPYLGVSTTGGTKIYQGSGSGSASGINVQELDSGASGTRARISIDADADATIDLFVSSWSAKNADFGADLPSTAKYVLTAKQSCGTTPPVASTPFPFVADGDTKLGSNVNSRYACAPDTNESGPELAYQIQVPEAGFLAVSLSDMPSGVDVDVHILDAAGACLSRGNVTAGVMVSSGAYKVVVDSWVGRDGVARSGRFKLRGGLMTTAALAAHGLTQSAANVALSVFAKAYSEKATESLVYAVADFDQLSNAQRFFVFDLAAQALIGRGYVAHGSASSDPNDRRRVASMSNARANMSSVGLFTTGALVGESLRLYGAELEFNDAAEARGLVLRASPYAAAQSVATNGTPGESDGSALIGSDIASTVLPRLREGSLFLSFFSDADWLARSHYTP